MDFGRNIGRKNVHHSVDEYERDAIEVGVLVVNLFIGFVLLWRVAGMSLADSTAGGGTGCL